jgi:hypothetical protein
MIRRGLEKQSRPRRIGFPKVLSAAHWRTLQDQSAGALTGGPRLLAATALLEVGEREIGAAGCRR